jgi:hypothetical protein
VSDLGEEIKPINIRHLDIKKDQRRNLVLKHIETLRPTTALNRVVATSIENGEQEMSTDRAIIYDYDRLLFYPHTHPSQLAHLLQSTQWPHSFRTGRCKKQ